MSVTAYLERQRSEQLTNALDSLASSPPSTAEALAVAEQPHTQDISKSSKEAVSALILHANNPQKMPRMLPAQPQTPIVHYNEYQGSSLPIQNTGTKKIKQKYADASQASDNPADIAHSSTKPASESSSARQRRTQQPLIKEKFSIAAYLREHRKRDIISAVAKITLVSLCVYVVLKII